MIEVAISPFTLNKKYLYDNGTEITINSSSDGFLLICKDECILRMENRALDIENAEIAIAIMRKIHGDNFHELINPYECFKERRI